MYSLSRDRLIYARNVCRYLLAAWGGAVLTAIWMAPYRFDSDSPEDFRAAFVVCLPFYVLLWAIYQFGNAAADIEKSLKLLAERPDDTWTRTHLDIVAQKPLLRHLIP